MDELRRRAQAWGEEVLAPPRWRLERVEERAQRHRASGRPSYRTRLRGWEVAGVARVVLPARGALSATFPVSEPLDLADGLAALADDAPDRPLIVEAALLAARRELAGDALGVRRIGRRAVRGGVELLVVVERTRADGELVLDLDATTGERLGLLAMPRLRGSDRSAALGRCSVIQRAREQAGALLGEDARVVRARLVHGPLGRVWRVRWRVGAQLLVTTLNARTGALCGWQRALRGAAAGQGPSRDEAITELRLAVELRLGRAPTPVVQTPIISTPIPGVRDGRPVWLAVVHAPDGRVFRAALDRGRVELVRRDAS